MQRRHLADQRDGRRRQVGSRGGDPRQRAGDRPLLGARPVGDDRGRRIGRHPGLDQPAGVRGQRRDAHQQHERARRGRQRRPVEVALRLGRILVAGHDRDLGRHAALRDGDSRVGGDGVGRRDPGDDLESHPGGRQRQRLLAAAAEDERIAALEADDRAQTASELDQQRVDLVLRHRVLPGLLAGVVLLGIRPGHRHDPGIGQPVVHQRVAALQQLTPANGQQPGVAGPCPDQVHGHAADHQRRRSSPPSCQANAATGTVQPPPSSSTSAALGHQLGVRRRMVERRTPGAPRPPAPAPPVRPGRPRAPAPRDRSGSRSDPRVRGGRGRPRPARSRRPRPRRGAARGCRRCPAAARSPGPDAAPEAGPTAAPKTSRRARRRAPPPATARAHSTRLAGRRAPAPLRSPGRGHVAGQILGAVDHERRPRPRPAPAPAHA